MDLNKLCSSESVIAWDRQIRLFAKYFLAQVALPANESFSLLDVGCGTGSALAEFKQKRPKGNFYGCDLEELHVEISKYLYQDAAVFFKSDITGISEKYDYIYISNVLEHIVDWKSSLLHLCKSAGRTFILVPFQEDLALQKRTGIDGVDHVNTYDKESFDFLVAYGFSIRIRIIRTPFAWGVPLLRECVNIIKGFISGVKYKKQRELLVEISQSKLNKKSDFKNSFKAFLNAISVR